MTSVKYQTVQELLAAIDSLVIQRDAAEALADGLRQTLVLCRRAMAGRYVVGSPQDSAHVAIDVALAAWDDRTMRPPMPSFDCGGDACGRYSCHSCTAESVRDEYWRRREAASARLANAVRSYLAPILIRPDARALDIALAEYDDAHKNATPGKPGVLQ